MHRFVLAALAAASATALLAVAAALAAPPGKNHYVVTPLASDVPGLAPATDANLKNTWGLARGDTTPWWIANNGTASTSVYNGAGTRVDIGGLPAQGVPGDPTGAVFSGIAGQFRSGRRRTRRCSTSRTSSSTARTAPSARGASARRPRS